jgi:hypothetical protein
METTRNAKNGPLILAIGLIQNIRKLVKKIRRRKGDKEKSPPPR